MHSSSSTTPSATSVESAARNQLQKLREAGDGAAFSALCRTLWDTQPELYSALCLPRIEAAIRTRWMAHETLDFRPSFRWGGLSVRARSVDALDVLLSAPDPLAVDVRSLRLEGVEPNALIPLFETGLCDGMRELTLQACGLRFRGSAYPLEEGVVQVTMKGHEALFQVLRDLGSLRVLRLPENRLGNKGMALLRGFEQLEGLELRGNAISDSGLSVLARFDSIERVGLANNRIQGPGLSHLKHLSTLRRLDLETNPLKELSSLGHLGGLEFLSLPRISEISEYVEDLSKLLPSCEIREVV